MNRNRQTGFTLAELMITTVLSLSVISSVMLGYLATSTSTSNTLAASKLTQDLNTLMSVMVSEFRRAGYSGTAFSATTPTTNPFNAIDDTALEVFDNMTDNNQVAATGTGSCIVYAYDLDEDGVVDASELLGFRLNSGVVEMRTSGNVSDPDSCTTSSNTWVDITDGNFITVTTLSFNLASSQCLNTREPDLVDNDSANGVDDGAEADCYDVAPTASSGDITVETRQIAITLTGNLANDSFVQLSQTQNVRIRNDLVRVR
jgi:prepilin peptidase dependent protein B